MKFRTLLFPLLFLFLSYLLLSCATGSGTSYETLVQSETETERETEEEDSVATEEEEEDNEEGSRLYIDTDPDDASVYLDGRFYGQTPLDITGLEPGVYRLDLEKKGYYSEFKWIEISEGSELSLDIELEAVTGFLQVNTKPSNASIYADSQEIRQGISELGIGTYSLRVKKFGYEDFQTTVIIKENLTTQINVKLNKAAFRITNESVSRKTFNPQNPGLIGQTEIKFEVSTYGKGTLRIFSDPSNMVLEKRFSSFQTWEQAFVWDGRDSEGLFVPEGRYHIEITGIGREESITDSKAVNVFVDYSAQIQYRSSWSGSSGLLFAQGAETIAAGSFQLSSVIIGHVGTLSTGATIGRFPLQLALRIGLSNHLEANINANLITYLRPESDNFITARDIALVTGLKMQILPLRGNFGLGISSDLSASFFSTVPSDSYSSFPSMRFALPIQLRLDWFNILLTPQIAGSTSWPYRETVFGPDIALWSYFRFALLADFDFLSTGLSLSLRTRPFHQGFSIQAPVHLGYEVHWMIPDTFLYLSGYAASEIVDFNNLFIMGGIGLGILY